jgi:para-nitrobenzyl esterase
MSRWNLLPCLLACACASPGTSSLPEDAGTSPADARIEAEGGASLDAEAAGDDGATSVDGASSDGGLEACTGDHTVSFRDGCVQGMALEGAEAFLGIPYARPPVGSLRWRPPERPEPWSGVRAATVFSKACPQLNPVLTGETLAWDEDCLYLNVFRPARTSTSTPVMLWIHGGGLQNGAASQPSYDGRYLASIGGVILVSINYRLAQLGYLAHPALTAESTDAVSGNYGLLDQIAALEWVRDNIAAFGGDPHDVTISGESAGGLSVCGLLASPRAAGLFSRAVIESAACPNLGLRARPLHDLPGSTIESAESQGLRVTAALGCTGSSALECMRSARPEAVLGALPAAQGFFGTGETYGFNVDGRVLPEAPKALLARGGGNPGPVLLGSNGDEGSIFTLGLMIRTEAQYIAFVDQIFGAYAPRVLALYPASNYATPKEAADALIGDAVFVCPTRDLSRALTMNGRTAFLYHFTHVTADAARLHLGAFHGSEITFVFGTVRQARTPPTVEELELSAAMMSYWTTFVRSGDPNTASLPAWRPYAPAEDRYQVLDLSIVPAPFPNPDACDLFTAF